MHLNEKVCTTVCVRVYEYRLYRCRLHDVDAFICWTSRLIFPLFEHVNLGYVHACIYLYIYISTYVFICMGICLHACFFACLVTCLLIPVCTCYVPHTSELHCAAIPVSLSLSSLMEFKMEPSV